jgi:DNA-3-methyladenine glycosylase I
MQDRTGTAGTSEDLVRGGDGLLRCWWAGGSALLERYHDEEWGRGPRDERGLFERLSLEAFQAGLSWRIVLERRTALREALAGFEPDQPSRASVPPTSTPCSTDRV